MTSSEVSSRPIRGMRKIIADHMQQSLRNSAQLTYHCDAEITELMQVRQTLNKEGSSISPEAFVIKATSNALKRHPEFNGITDSDTVHIYAAHNISLAVETSSGLMTVTLPNVDELSLAEIAELRREKIEKAMAGSLNSGDVKGGTFTISNLGQTPIRFFTPILNAGQIAILGLGSSFWETTIDDQGSIGRRQMLPLSLTTDHRVVDGSPSGAFLRALSEELELVGPGLY